MTPMPAEFTHLDGFLLPDEFWPAFGYEGQARFVGLFWTPFGDEAIYTDGRVEADGCWQAYVLLVAHPTNAELLHYPCWACQGRGTTSDLWNEPCEECDGVGTLEYNLGSQFLREQWPPPEPLTTIAADIVIEALRQAMS
jgi:hypothetical protein